MRWRRVFPTSKVAAAWTQETRSVSSTAARVEERGDGRLFWQKNESPARMTVVLASWAEARAATERWPAPPATDEMWLRLPVDATEDHDEPGAPGSTSPDSAVNAVARTGEDSLRVESAFGVADSYRAEAEAERELRLRNDLDSVTAQRDAALEEVGRLRTSLSQQAEVVKSMTGLPST